MRFMIAVALFYAHLQRSTSTAAATSAAFPGGDRAARQQTAIFETHSGGPASIARRV